MNIDADYPRNDQTSQAEVDAGYRLVASYPDYPQAQRAVDYLSDSGFAVENLRVLGHGVTTVEAITGRMTTGRAVLSGAASGAWFGLFIGLLLGMFTVGTGWLDVMAAGLFIGAAWGAIFGFAGRHWATRGRRDFTSTSTLAAERYDVVCAPAFVGEAAQLLTKMGLPPAH
jgi:hypothetical protein